jgi:hypothetical protein
MSSVPPDTNPQHNLTAEEQEAVRLFIKVAKLCAQRPELVEPVNRVLALVGLELQRVH